MTILHATADIKNVSLWLRRADAKTTELYPSANSGEMLEISEADTPLSIRPGRLPSAHSRAMLLLKGK